MKRDIAAEHVANKNQHCYKACCKRTPNNMRSMIFHPAMPQSIPSLWASVATEHAEPAEPAEPAEGEAMARIRRLVELEGDVSNLGGDVSALKIVANELQAELRSR